MPFPLVPTWRAEDVNGIPADFLREQGIRLVLLLMIFRYIRNEDEYEENWVEELRKLCIK